MAAIDPMAEFVENAAKAGKPAFLSFLSGVSHQPYELPTVPGFIPHQYNGSPHPLYVCHSLLPVALIVCSVQSAYVNTVSFVDFSLEKAWKRMEQIPGFMNNTLFVFLGTLSVCCS